MMASKSSTTLYLPHSMRPNVSDSLLRNVNHSVILYVSAVT